MEGDAGTGRLNPIDTDDSLNPQEQNEDPAESTEDADQPEPEGVSEEEAEPEAGSAEPAVPVERGPSRVGRGWLAGIAAVLVLCAGGIGVGGYLALHYHRQSQATARNDAAALKAALDCVGATQAPDTNAMTATEQKIIECGTDAYRSQALLYTSMLIQAYQAANIHVQVSDMRAAVERNNKDGSVNVLVALRVKVANDQSQSESGYRLRATMALTDGQYKISKLDQVTK